MDLFWIYIFLLLAHLQGYVYAEDCRSKFGVYKPADFNIHACSWCYYFMFPVHILKPGPDNYLHLNSNSSKFVQGTKFIPDIHNSSSIEAICSTLTHDECNRWKLCCRSASDCCAKQIRTRDVSNNTCMTTWDGFGCWDIGQKGVTSHMSCPNFLQFSIPTRSALKKCQSDGTWLTKGGHDWTDYTPCLNYEELKVTIILSLGCQIASLIFLVPAVAVFVRYKSLISQHRIRLHLNFFISFIMSGIINILWKTMVIYDKLTNINNSDTLMYKNSPECKLLSFLKLFFTSTNYVWMFCEGLYLYWLIVNAFSPPKRLLPFYIFGWGTPLIYTSSYAILRVSTADKSCWANSLGDKEWIIYAPNLTCLIANIYFLCSILRILLTQLQVHPNEPSNFRKALKATFILLPLFGVQLVVTIYRLPPESPGSLYYERLSELITHSQGFFVSLIFCLCNGEVLTLLKHSWKRRRDDYDFSSKRGVNNTTSLNLNTTIIPRYASNKYSPNRSQVSLLKNGSEQTAL